MADSPLDCVIVGAGVAGLVTARELVALGRSCVVLEAQGRVGGRTLSPDFGPARLDLGGQWIGPRQTHIRRLAGELGLATFPQYHRGASVSLRGGRRSVYRGPLPPLSPLASVDLLVANLRLGRQVAALRRGAADRIARWDAVSLESWLESHLMSRAGRDLMRSLTRAVLAAEPSEMSLFYFLDYLRRGGSLREVAGIPGGAQETRIVDGMQSVSARMAAALGERVRLGEPVRSIEQGARGVVVRTAAGIYRAERAVVTVPPALCSRIHYEPALPARRDAATQRLPMGSAIKYLVQYERPFWRAAGLSGIGSTDGGVVEMAMDACSADGSVSALVAFTVGAPARRWTACAPEARRRAVLAALVELYGREAATPIQFAEKSWLEDPWSRGCYVGVAGPGVYAEIQRTLSAPCGRIHWAGGETADDWPGVDGAVQSGQRAAREIHLRLEARPAAAAGAMRGAR